MAVSNKPRKKFNPAFQLHRGVSIPNVMFRNSPQELLVFKLRPHLYLDMFGRDTGTKASLQGMEFRIGMLRLLAPLFDQTEAIEEIANTGSAAITSIIDRIRLQRSYYMTPEEKLAIGQAICTMDEAQDLITRREQADAAVHSLRHVNANPVFGFEYQL